MFNRFSREDRTLLMFAMQEARDLGHPALGNDHLILGMLCNARSSVFALLGDTGFTLDAARATVAEYHDEHDEAPTPDAERRYEEDREALKTIGIDLDRVREAVRSRFGDDLTEGWGERRRRGHDRGHGGDCGEHRGRHGHGHGRGRGRGPGGDADGFDGGPWDGGRGRRGPRGRGRGRFTEPVRDALRAAVALARSRGDSRLTIAHLLLGILEVGDPASRAVIESVTDVETLRAAVKELLEPAAV